MSWHFFQCKIMSRGSKKAVNFSGPWRAQWHPVSHTLCWNCFHATHHVGLPQRFTHAVHLLWAGAAHDKVLRHHGAADQIQGADERLKGFGIQPSNDRLDVVWPEPGGDHSGCQGWLVATPLRCVPFHAVHNVSALTSSHTTGWTPCSWRSWV